MELGRNGIVYDGIEFFKTFGDSKKKTAGLHLLIKEKGEEICDVEMARSRPFYEQRNVRTYHRWQSRVDCESQVFGYDLVPAFSRKSSAMKRNTQ